MTVPAAFVTGVDQSVITAFTAIRIEFPAYTANVIDAASYVRIDVDGQEELFEGSDPVIGTISDIGDLQQSLSDESVRLTLRINPPTSEALALVTHPNVQRGRVRIWLGTIDPKTNAVESQYLAWEGMIDTPSVTASQGIRYAELECVTHREVFMMLDESRRLNVAWHSRHFPGARGLAFNVLAMDDPPWGAKGVGRFGGSGGGGGYNGGGGSGGGGRDGGGGAWADLV
ncbi:hypothetical protein [Brevundimonas sp.]|uniref:hypothetical protein n=1 Tax=Brevundimonas sp. TaxID=1871086 RepID=UPI0035B4F0C4